MNDLNFSPIERPAALQKVVIVGRPNVGKSTLFNRLLGRRRAITDAMPGVTRDPVESPCTIEGRSFALVDTGGFKLERDAMDDLINGRIFKSLSEAALILFVLDIIEFTPEDEEFCDQLRAYSSKVLLVVNKMDTPGRDDLLWNHFSLGFGRTLGISAAHSRGMEELEKAIVDFLGPAGETEAPVRGEAGIRLAILGKPNTGKSTLVNTLTGKDVSLVSAIPGTTRDVIEGFFAFKGRSFRILDTAGIRRKNRVN
ncbi:MAG: GTP-binding protein, partial [Spirochaetales bacterium]